ncbi:alpha/beta hydrolase [Acidimangrovimonas pyrenivorans]|uniref:Alpha/beta hydrolase n=1 Tax=Acidimangrovimonas pyrenivorans TaxID=2030798 RepID=A0ABV7AHF7_9RHOB
MTTRPQILFIHGWWSTGWVWSRFERAFRARGYRTRAVDLPYRIEGTAPGRIGFGQLVDAAAAAAREMDNPVLVGHSAGGLIAQKLAEIGDPPACVCLGPAAPRGILAIATLDMLRLALRYAPAMLLSRTFLPGPDEMRRFSLNRLPEAEHAEVRAQMSPQSGRVALQMGLAGIPVDAARVTAPMLVIGAGQDRMTPPRVTRAIARRYGADYKEYPDNAHFMLREPGWETIAGDVMDWIEGATEKGTQ